MTDIAVAPTWAGVLAAVLGIVGVLLARRWRGQDSAEEREIKREQAMRKAAKEWRLALARGDAALAAKAKDRYQYLKAGGQFFVAMTLMAGVMFCGNGCRTSEAQPPRIVAMSEHVLFPEAGSVVPMLPDGERRWLLVSVPTGTELVLPLDFPAVETEVESEGAE